MGIMHELSPHPVWVDTLHRFARPYWDALLNGEFAESATATRLTVDELRGWIVNMYPFIHTFPKFLAEALIKVEDDLSRSSLIDNIRVEKAHAEHWLWMAEGFGLQEEICSSWRREIDRHCATCNLYRTGSGTSIPKVPWQKQLPLRVMRSRELLAT